MLYFDLSQPFQAGMATSTDPNAFSMDVYRSIQEGDAFNWFRLHLQEHVGTHMDSPFHFRQEGRKINELKMEEFFVESRIIDLSDLQPNELITKEMLLAYEKEHGLIPTEKGLILYTGWSRTWGTMEYLQQNPGLSAEAAEYLASKNPILIGLDIPSVDVRGDSAFPAHHAILSRDIPIIETLSGELAKVLEVSKDFLLVATPLKIIGGTASPVRPIAIIK